MPVTPFLRDVQSSIQRWRRFWVCPARSLSMSFFAIRKKPIGLWQSQRSSRNALTRSLKCRVILRRWIRSVRFASSVRKMRAWTRRSCALCSRTRSVRTASAGPSRHCKKRFSKSVYCSKTLMTTFDARQLRTRLSMMTLRGFAKLSIAPRSSRKKWPYMPNTSAR